MIFTSQELLRSSQPITEHDQSVTVNGSLACLFANTIRHESNPLPLRHAVDNINYFRLQNKFEKIKINKSSIKVVKIGKIVTIDNFKIYSKSIINRNDFKFCRNNNECVLRQMK